MKKFWNAFALKAVWDGFFMNDAHFIVSRRGLEILYKMQQKQALIDLMDLDKDLEMSKQELKQVSPLTSVCVDKEAADAYLAQYNNEEELRKEGAIDFAKWLAKEWMSMWVVDKWLWENVSVDTNDQTKWKGYYTEEQLYELYLKEQHGND